MSRLAVSTIVWGTFLFCLVAAARADVVRWDNGQPIPGTEGIQPGPGVRLDNRGNLAFADLANLVLSDASFQMSNLRDARFDNSALTNADFTDARIERASFTDTTSRGFTEQQLYSTYSYVQRDLQQINLAENDLAEWNLRFQRMNLANLANSNLAGTDFNSADLTSANLQGTNLTNAVLYWAHLGNAVLSGAVIEGARLGYTTGRGFTKDQLYSTASYQDKSLTYMAFTNNDMTGWNFSDQNLTLTHFDDSVLASADFSGANLTNVYFNGASLVNADLSNTIVSSTAFWRTDITKEQLYSTASYQEKNLSRVELVSCNLTGWDFTGHDLTNAKLHFSTLKNANFTDAEIEGTSFSTTTTPERGFTKEQLYSTASYKRKNLSGVNLVNNNLSGWDFRNQNLTDAVFFASILNGADFTGALISGAHFDTTGFAKETLYATASYQRRDLRGISITLSDLTNWDFRGQDLRSANFEVTTLSNAMFALADLRSVVNFAPQPATDLRNAIRPDGAIEGLSLQADETLVVRDFTVNAVVSDGFSMANSSILEFVFGNRGGGAMMSISGDVVPDLGGTLRLAFGPDTDFADISGATIDLFDWHVPLDVANRFDRVDTPPGSQWDLSQLYTTGQVTLRAVPEPPAIGLIAMAGLVAVTGLGVRGLSRKSTKLGANPCPISYEPSPTPTTR